MVLEIFKIAPPFERSACFYATIIGDFEHFQCCNFETNFLKKESTKIGKASFPYKTANIKTSRMGNTKWTYHKEWSFTSNYFAFFKILFQFKNLL